MLSVLINDSGIYGLWMIKTLLRANLKFKVVFLENSDVINLENSKALFVPGGWSENKFQWFSDESKAKLREFLNNGGLYFGICGGASLASNGFLNLIDIQRDKEGVKIFSGPAKIKFYKHPLTNNLDAQQFLWYPPKFKVLNSKVRVLARFDEPLDGAYISDIPWEYLKVHRYLGTIQYHGNLFSTRLVQKNPVMMLERFGDGYVLVTTIHFDTPNSTGIEFFNNLRNYFSLETTDYKSNLHKSIQSRSKLQDETIRYLNEIYGYLHRAFDCAVKSMLMYKRYDFFYAWRKNIRGSEFQTLYFLILELLDLLSSYVFSDEAISKTWDLLTYQVKMLPELERIVRHIENSVFLSKLAEDPENEEIKNHFLKEAEREYFGYKKSKDKRRYSGVFREVLNNIERVLTILYNEILRC
uniref:Biotin-protein ligase N-terminal domain-containing protein n=1 Tax=Fervidobacterium pennivorans TaxID=93466 RepID=A0A7V4CNU8_FERPE